MRGLKGGPGRQPRPSHRRPFGQPHSLSGPDHPAPDIPTPSGTLSAPTQSPEALPQLWRHQPAPVRAQGLGAALPHLGLLFYSLWKSPRWGPEHLQPLARMAFGASSPMPRLVFIGRLSVRLLSLFLLWGEHQSKSRARIQTLGWRWPDGVAPRRPSAAPHCIRVPEEPGAEEPTSPEESSGLSLLHQESKRRAMLAAVLEQERRALADVLCPKQEQVGVPAAAPPGGEAWTGSRRMACPTPPPPPATLLTQVGAHPLPTPLPPQGPHLGRNHVEQLLRCLGAHIHTPNRRRLAQELRALQGQLRAQGLGPALLHGPLFAFPDAVRELSYGSGSPIRGSELPVPGNVQGLDIARLPVFPVKIQPSEKGHLPNPSLPAPPSAPSPPT